MRLLVIGDIVGRPGRKAIKASLMGIKQELKLDFIIANGENAAGGNGITREISRELFAAGVNVLTMGNHVWDKKEIFEFIDEENRIVRPANYPPGSPGHGSFVYDCGNIKIGVANLSGRVFMPELDCPFRKADEIIKLLKKETDIIIVDFHAEATSEKIAMGWYLDGRVSAVCGTHTHVQTADERILPDGTAYITDLGMTGPRDSVLGVQTELVIDKFLTALPTRFEVSNSLYQLNGVIIEIDEETGLATSIERLQEFE